MKKLTYILLLLVFIQVSCTDTYTFCNESKTVQFTSFFYKKVAGNEISTNAPDLTIVDISSGATIFSNQPNISSFSLSLNPLKDSMKFQIKLAPTLPVDTLTVVYSTQNKSLSPDCGVISTHTILRTYATKHSLDTIKLTNASVSNDNLPNSRIIF